jgi:uncharacterized protein (DUF362 family)
MRRIFRREFLAGSLAAACTGKAVEAKEGTPAPRARVPSEVVDVSGTDRKAMVKVALEALGGIGAFVKRGDKVVLKLNIAMANPSDWATTTHPDTIAAVAEACLGAGAKEVAIVEHPLAKGESCVERTGLRAALKPLPDVRVRMLESSDEFREVSVPGGVSLKSTEVARAVLEADVFINLPQAKEAGSAGVSFGLKNGMGAIWSRMRFHLWLDLQQAIADLGQVVRPHLTILDATRVLLTNGPKGPGDTADLGRMIAGRAIAAVDAYGLTLAPFHGRQLTPADVKHILLASQAGLGEADVAKIKVTRLAS